MTSTGYNFVRILELFESKGWKLQKIRGRHRVFTRAGRNPWLIPVENNQVKVEYVKQIKQFFKEEENESGDSR